VLIEGKESSFEYFSMCGETKQFANRHPTLHSKGVFFFDALSFGTIKLRVSL